MRSEEGYALSVRRMIEPESVFGQIKNNRVFRHFLLRGLPKVSLEVGIQKSFPLLGQPPLSCISILCAERSYW
ncbi:transposase [Paenibacillus sp. GP183]|uniref:transposase n=1 Tax=Paenibacillus sp. GP183 TaxID=1882751 RepID=UPI00209AFC5B|nr:transposase [Paenibacillus sp. GP183]